MCRFISVFIVELKPTNGLMVNESMISMTLAANAKS